MDELIELGQLIDIMTVWFAAGIVALLLASQTPNGEDELRGLFYTLQVQNFARFVWYLLTLYFLLPISIPFSLYKIFKKRR